MKFAKNKYPLCSASECEQDCIFFDRENEHCNIGNGNELFNEMFNSPKLREYIKLLKNRYNRCEEFKQLSIQENMLEKALYWECMKTCIKNIFNDLGLGYYL